ncbi:hypothetical protein [Pseudarthrobacter enclensis]|uniref:hypothetical protein n=1 Tax=Pseudarthrobacter enclensis TaxID=993070 RepID=UPI003EE0A2B5
MPAKKTLFMLLLAIASFCFAATGTGVAFIGWMAGLLLLLAALLTGTSRRPESGRRNRGL